MIGLNHPSGDFNYPINYYEFFHPQHGLPFFPVNPGLPLHVVPGCDTFVALPPVAPPNTVIFGKNSDRPNGEGQSVRRYPGGTFEPWRTNIIYIILYIYMYIYCCPEKTVDTVEAFLFGSITNNLYHHRTTLYSIILETSTIYL